MAETCHLAYLLSRKSRADSIALRPLNEYNLNSVTVFVYLFKRGRIVNPSVFKLGLIVFHTEIGKRTRSVVCSVTDDIRKRVIRTSCYGKHNVAGTEKSEKRDGYRMRAVYNTVTAESRLRSENIGINLIKCIPAVVRITVARRSGKHRIRHAMLCERAQHLFRIFFGYSVKLRENRSKRFSCRLVY